MAEINLTQDSGAMVHDSVQNIDYDAQVEQVSSL